MTVELKTLVIIENVDIFSDLKKLYYSMLGQLDIYSKSLIKDKDELEKLEANQTFSKYFVSNQAIKHTVLIKYSVYNPYAVYYLI